MTMDNKHREAEDIILNPRFNKKTCRGEKLGGSEAYPLSLSNNIYELFASLKQDIHGTGYTY
jgi:hypothetical protein